MQAGDDGDAAGPGEERDERPETTPGPLIEPAPSPADSPRRRQVVAELDWPTLIYLAAAVLAAWAALGVFRMAADTLTAIAIGVVLALALDQVVGALRRRYAWSRHAAVALVIVVLALAVTLVIVFLGPAAVRQAADFGQELPETVESLYDLPVVGDRLEAADAANEIVTWIEELPGNITAEELADLVDRLIGGTASAIIIFLVAFAVLLDGELIVNRSRRAVPERHRERVDWVARVCYRSFARYFAGSLLLAVFTGVYVLTIGLILGVPLAPLAALWAMFTDLIPQVGGFLGGSVFVMLALTVGITTGVLALILFVAYMSSENYLLHPTIVGGAVNLSPPATMLAALAGAATAGVPGVLVATPLAGAIKALYLELRFGPPPEQGRGRPPLPIARVLERIRGRTG